MFESLAGILFLFFAFFNPSPAEAADDAVKWDYWTSTGNASKWPTLSKNCSGSSQSPINLHNAAYEMSLGNITLTNYGPADVNATALNTARTYKVSFNGLVDATTPEISGGGLPGTFILAQFHLHWGSNDGQGSEHTLHGKSYPAEIHFVHLNKKYPNLTEGLKHWDGLAVLGVFFKSGKHNDHYNFLNLTTHNVTYPDQTANFNIPSLMALLPSDKSFYRYNGSLTTPGCQEVVTWTVFNQYVEISDAQLKELRGMMYIDDSNTTQALVDNYRPVLPLNGRMLLTNSKALAKPTTESTTEPATESTTEPTMTTTDGAYRVSENFFMFIASLCLVLLSFLEI